MGAIDPPAGAAIHRRIEGDRGPSLAERVHGGVHRLSYRTFVHRLRLGGRYPQRLLATPRDPLTGDAIRGQAIARGLLAHAGHAAPADPARWSQTPAPLAWTTHAHGFAWLRDLAAADALAAAPTLIAAWLTHNARYRPASWSPETLGERLLFWSIHAPALTATENLVHRSAFLNALARQHRHAARTAAAAPAGAPRLTAAIGVVAGALMLPHAEARLAAAEALLARTLATTIAPDGGTPTRAPDEAARFVDRLLTLAAIYTARARPTPPAQADATARLSAALAALTLGDGRLAAFHGGAPIQATMLLAADPPAPAPTVAGGYQRLAAGDTVLLLDAAPPAEARVSATARASTLAFELSSGPVRLIAGGGAPAPHAPPPPAEIQRAARTTAAHATLVAASRNSTRIRPDGRLGAGVCAVTVARDGDTIEAEHDGYRRRLGVLHRRRLWLAPNGRELRGEDMLRPARRRAGQNTVPATIHFPLAPGCAASIEGDDALIAAATQRWRLRARGATIAMAEGFAINVDGGIAPTTQLVLIATGSGPVAWVLAREA